MTNKSIKLFAASALAISALGLSAVATSMTAEAATVTRQADKVEYVSNAFSTFDAAKAFTDSNDMYAGFAGRFGIYPLDLSDASKGYVIDGYVDGFFDEAEATQGHANVSDLMLSADTAAAASWSSAPQPDPAQPEAPVTPVEPTAPVTPSEPETPVTPTEPTTSITLTQPETPVTPAEPATPTEPTTPIEVSNDQKSSTTDVKTLPNTGDAGSVLSIIGSGLLSLGGYVALKRK